MSNEIIIKQITESKWNAFLQFTFWIFLLCSFFLTIFFVFTSFINQPREIEEIDEEEEHLEEEEFSHNILSNQ